MDPKPLQRPHIPIIVGGHSPAAYRRAARFGNGWYGFQLNQGQVANARAHLEQALRAEGRTSEDFELIITPPYRVDRDMVSGYRDVGVDRLIVHLGNQQAERVDARMNEVEALVRVAV